VLGDRDAADELLIGEDFLAVQQVVERVAGGAGGFAGDAFFFIGGRVIDLDEEHEAVELRFREWVGAFLFDRVLGGEDEKRRLQRVGVSEQGHLVFLHRLQHGGLSLGRGAVDFVGEHDVGDHRAFDELELPFAAAPDFWMMSVPVMIFRVPRGTPGRFFPVGRLLRRHRAGVAGWGRMSNP
jgi:hypothetical protein